MKKFFLAVLTACLCFFCLAGCEKILSFLGLDSFVAAVEDIEEAKYLQSRAEVSVEYGGNTLSRTVLFRLSRENGTRAYMEFEEDEDAFMLYYYDGVFYLNEDGNKTVMPFDFESMAVLSLYNYVDEKLLLEQLSSVEIDKKDGVDILKVEIDTEKVKTLIEQMMTSVGFSVFPDTITVEAACRDEKIEYLDVAIGGMNGLINFEIGVHITYTFEQTEEFPKIDINQFKSGNGKRSFYPMKLYTQSEERAELSDNDYLALPQVWEKGQTEQNEAYYSEYTNDWVKLYRIKNNVREVVLEERTDVIDHTVYTFNYTNITIDGEYVYFLGKNSNLYRLHRETKQLELMDRGEYDVFRIIDGWIIAFSTNTSGAFAISKDGTQRYSLNSFDEINTQSAQLLGTDRGYVYFGLYSSDFMQSVVMRVGVEQGTLVFERVDLPLAREEAHILSINLGLLNYSYVDIIGPQDGSWHGYVFDTMESFVWQDNYAGIRQLYAGNQYIMNYGKKVLSVEWKMDEDIGAYGDFVTEIDLQTGETRLLMMLPDSFELGRICGSHIELITETAIYRLEEDGTITEFKFF